MHVKFLFRCFQVHVLNKMIKYASMHGGEKINGKTDYFKINFQIGFNIKFYIGNQYIVCKEEKII